MGARNAAQSLGNSTFPRFPAWAVMADVPGLEQSWIRRVQLVTALSCLAHTGPTALLCSAKTDTKKLFVPTQSQAPWQPHVNLERLWNLSSFPCSHPAVDAGL